VDEDVDVVGAKMRTEEGLVVADFKVTVGNLHRLRKLIRTLGRLKGVRSVERRRTASDS
jgi:(p)ppGpp synthase/HD superfamily hydrolase